MRVKRSDTVTRKNVKNYEKRVFEKKKTQRRLQIDYKRHHDDIRFLPASELALLEKIFMLKLLPPLFIHIFG